ncbi:unnamed protein product [Owenia fusiformis]|uniref:Uncharacterized protein n=1 Tax=Owenia fusiformis TaxID=6347 RepID=A0A8J1TWR0_OWEFU|nr:unnamed protein product [Owenia fusiformis]
MLKLWINGLILATYTFRGIYAQCNCPRNVTKLHEEYCKADFVIRVIPLNQFPKQGLNNQRYYVKLLEVFKGPKHLMEKVGKRTSVFTKAELNRCGVYMELDMKYLLMGYFNKVDRNLGNKKMVLHACQGTTNLWENLLFKHRQRLRKKFKLNC